MKNGRPQIKDIPDQEFVDAIRAMVAEGFGAPSVVSRLDQKYHWKLIYGKLESMYRRGVIDYHGRIERPFVVGDPPAPPGPSIAEILAKQQARTHPCELCGGSGRVFVLGALCEPWAKCPACRGHGYATAPTSTKPQ